MAAPAACVVLVEAEDWQGLYVDGLLVAQNHRIEVRDIAGCMGAKPIVLFHRKADSATCRHLEVHAGFPAILPVAEQG